MRRTVSIRTLSVLTLVSCSDATGPGVASFAVTPNPVFLVPGDTVRLTVDALNAGGQLVTGIAVSFQTTDSAIIEVSAVGLVRALGPTGSTTVRVSGGGTSTDVPVTVIPFPLGVRITLGGGPHGAALSSAGVAYITLPASGQLARADLPSQAFAPAVTVGSVPTEVAFNSTGTRAYVTNQFSQNVSIVDVASNTVIDSILVTDDPFEVIVEPGDSIIYVSTRVNHYVSTRPHRVYAIRLSTKTAITSFATPGVSTGMLIRDTLLYVSTHTGGTVIEFNLRTQAVARTFTVGGIPQKMALSADRNTLFIANEAGYVQFWNLVSGTQDGANLALPAGSAGHGIARRASHGLLYVTTAYGQVFGSGRGSVHVIDPVSRRLVYTAVTGGSTRDITFNTSGSIGFVPNEGGWVDFLR